MLEGWEGGNGNSIYAISSSAKCDHADYNGTGTCSATRTIEQFSVNAKYGHDSSSHAENKENRR